MKARYQPKANGATRTRRKKASLSSVSPFAYTNSITNTNTFLYDGWLLVQEQSVSGGNPTTNSYIWGLDLSGSLQGDGGIGGLLSVVDGRARSPSEPFFPCFDANGNITEYVDETGTNVVAHYEYGPFGQIIAKSGTKADDFHFRFSTKYYDAETGLYYYGYRYYSPELGRWVNRDPLGEEENLVSLYVALENDPIASIDLLGKLSLPP
ncbi:MAG: RHS repeat domain-containing protein, partial [Verrucomicrobiota bacterium]